MDVCDRARDAADWVRWHQVELAVVTPAAVAAVTVSPWWATVTAAVVSRWWWCERHARRDGARDTAGRDERDESPVAS